MKFNRWSWGYIPVALVLGLIWFEFWHSGAFRPAEQPAPAPDSSDAAAAAPDNGAAPAPAIPGNGAPGLPVNPPEVAVGPRTAVVPIAPPIGPPPVVPLVPLTPAKPVIDDAFLHNPPPITVSLTGETLPGAVAAIRDSFHMPASFEVLNGGAGNNQTYTLEAKNKPFWEVMRSLQDQGRFAFTTSGAGLTLSPSGGIYHFDISGPAILYPTAVTYSRSVSAQAPGDRAPGVYQITFGAAVDPRISIARTYPVQVIEATDETGRVIPVNGPNGAMSSLNQYNFWTSTVAIPETPQRAKALNLKCQVRFAALLANSTATIEDASTKQGELITVGDRKLRLTRAEIQGTMFMMQVSSEDGTPITGITCQLTSSNGRTITIPLTTTATRNYSTTLYQPPYTLSFRDTSARAGAFISL